MKVDIAKSKVISYIESIMSIPVEDPLLFIDEDTIETAWGWILYYNGTKYLTTGDAEFCWVGNVPMYYDWKRNRVGAMWRPDKTIKQLIMEYEAKHGY